MLVTKKVLTIIHETITDIVMLVIKSKERIKQNIKPFTSLLCKLGSIVPNSGSYYIILNIQLVQKLLLEGEKILDQV